MKQTIQQRMAIVVLLIALAITAVIVGETYRSARRYAQMNGLVRRSYDVKLALGDTLTLLDDAETGQRGYLLGGSAQYLQPYRAATAQIDQQLATLADLTRDDPAQSANVAEIHRLAETKLAELGETIRLYEAGKNDEAHKLLMSGVGERTMADFRRAIAQTEMEEDQLLSERTAGASRESWVVIVLALTILPLSVGAYMVFLRVIHMAMSNETLAHKEVDRRGAVESELRDTQRNLERIVEERTEQLDRSNQALRRLSTRLLRVQDEERRQISRELHDSAGQYLAAVGMALEAIRNEAHENPKITEKLEMASQMNQACMTEVRTISHLLHPPLLEEVGLSAAARWYVDGFSNRSGIAIDLEMPEEMDRLGSDIELALFRVLQESLTNVHRHSKSKTASVKIDGDGSQVSLEIRDRGKGGPINADGFQPGVGIAGMRERVKDLSGVLEIVSGETGTVVKAVIPLADHSQETRRAG